ncbi:hypothetical protein [Lutibacter sp.]
MKNILFNLIVITFLSVLFTSCNNKTSKSKTTNIENKSITQAEIYNTKGYELLKSKCYICHFEKPDPSKMNQMIAPPMLRVKEHYFPNYPNKEDFINAVMAIVKNPSEEKTLMPGAVKKFNLMPKVIYEDEDLRLIAETIYNLEFGTAPKVRMQTMELSLNNGEKWVVKPETYKIIQEVGTKISNFNADSVAEYNQLGKDVFDKAKFVLMDDSYSGELFNQLHNFFYGIEGEMHLLIAEKDIKKAKQTTENLKIKLNDFYLIFKVK